VIVLHSLSKRSCAAGMRSGFAVGDPAAITALNRLRLNGTACMPLPLFAASTALWNDETHVDAMRKRLVARFDLADKWLRDYPGYYRPRAGFFLWLQVPDGVQMTRRFWSEAAVKVLAGEYLTQPSADGTNEGSRFVRIALVHDLDLVDEGLRRIAGLL
jgi:N-succinyldiaminopimelate aminotransferase